MAAKVFRTKVTPESNGRKARKAVKLTMVAGFLVLDVLVDTWNAFPEHMNMLKDSTRRFKFMKEKYSKNY